MPFFPHVTLFYLSSNVFRRKMASTLEIKSFFHNIGHFDWQKTWQVVIECPRTELCVSCICCTLSCFVQEPGKSFTLWHALQQKNSWVELGYFHIGTVGMSHRKMIPGTLKPFFFYLLHKVFWFFNKLSFTSSGCGIVTQ